MDPCDIRPTLPNLQDATILTCPQMARGSYIYARGSTGAAGVQCRPIRRVLCGLGALRPGQWRDDRGDGRGPRPGARSGARPPRSALCRGAEHRAGRRRRTAVAAASTIAVLVLAGCGSSDHRQASPSTVAPIAPIGPITTVYEITVDSPSSACVAWSKIWPTIDRLTINGDMGPLSTLIATGGPDQALYALTDWAQGQMSGSSPSAFSDDLNIALHHLSALQPGDNTGPLRAAAEIVNVDCQAVPPPAATAGAATSVGCTPGDLGQAYIDQGAPEGITNFTLASCDQTWALAVGVPAGSTPDAQAVAFFKLGANGAQLLDVVPQYDGAATAVSLGMPAATYTSLTGSLHS